MITPLKTREAENSLLVTKLEEAFKTHLVHFYDLELDNTGPLRSEIQNMKKKIDDYEFERKKFEKDWVNRTLET